MLGARGAPWLGGMGRRAKSTFRRNAITDQWVVFSEGRRGRPMQVKRISKAQKTTLQPPHDPACPFCKGNEHLTPPPLLELRDDAGDWAVRVVPNKYPAVVPPSMAPSIWGTAKLTTPKAQVNVERPAIGHHEVVVESPRHNDCTALASVAGIERLVTAWHTRGRRLHTDDPAAQTLLLFKNQGAVAGASLLHPHCQLITLPFVARNIQNRQQRNLDYFRMFGVSVFQKTIDEEYEARARGGPHRIVEEHADFIAFIPFAAISPFNLWIVPLFPEAHFILTPPERLKSFADILSRCLRRLHDTLDEPDYNMVLRSAPLPGRGAQLAYNHAAFFRWHLILTPRLGAGAMAGFELGSGMFSNCNFPEDDAARLRTWTPDPDSL